MMPDRLAAALADRYRLEHELGAGGMATVYLAEDLKHDRKVAIKVLKPDLAAVLGAERFIAEIKTTAALSHPHILPLFDSGEAGGFLYYVMPYLQAETIRERLNRETQFGVEEAVRIAREVADALDHAHRHGVIHRDIKPENILLYDGRAMVMDFGIALAVSAAAGGRMTETGLSLGTPHYMSPEQATADKQITARSDVYSLASVLYEMLAGEPPHMGNSAQQIIMKIVTDVPRPVGELRKAVPPNVAAAVATALQKLPADRFESAAKFAAALTDPAFQGSTATRVTPNGTMGGAGRLRDPVFLAVAGLALAASIVAGVALREPGTGTEGGRVTRVGITMPEGEEYSWFGGNPVFSHVAISPDGRELSYRTQRGGPPGAPAVLWRRRLSELTGSEVLGTTDMALPRFSRDGALLAFRSTDGDRTGVVPATGGTPVWLDGGSAVFAWGHDEAIYFFQDDSLYRWVPGVGQAEALRARPAGLVGLTSLDVLPGNAGFLISRGDGELVALDREAPDVVSLGLGTSVRYLPTGHLVFARDGDGTLMVQPFDAQRLRTTGPAVATPDRVPPGLLTSYDIADDGTLVYLASAGEGGDQLTWITPDGRRTPIDWIPPVRLDAFELSPAGDAIAISFSPGQSGTGNDIWRFDLATRSRIRLTSDGRSSRPSWHPTEPRLVHVAQTEDGPELRTMPADRSAAGTPLVALSGNPADAFWLRDGTQLVIRQPGRQSPRSIFRFTPGTDSQPVPYLDREWQDRAPAPSPDGRWMVYTSNESGRDEVYAQPFPQGGAVIPISIDGGTSARWSRDGRQLFYNGADGHLWAADVHHDAGTFRVERRTQLFATTDLNIDPQRARYDMAPDGRFLVPVVPQRQGADPIVLVRNWVQSVTAPRSTP